MIGLNLSRKLRIVKDRMKVAVKGREHHSRKAQNAMHAMLTELSELDSRVNKEIVEELRSLEDGEFTIENIKRILMLKGYPESSNVFFRILESDKNELDLVLHEASEQMNKEAIAVIVGDDMEELICQAEESNEDEAEIENIFDGLTEEAKSVESLDEFVRRKRDELEKLRSDCVNELKTKNDAILRLESIIEANEEAHNLRIMELEMKFNNAEEDLNSRLSEMERDNEILENSVVILKKRMDELRCEIDEKNRDIAAQGRVIRLQSSEITMLRESLTKKNEAYFNLEEKYNQKRSEMLANSSTRDLFVAAASNNSGDGSGVFLSKVFDFMSF